MMTARVFQSGNSQAIRIPRELRTSRSEFVIHKIGEAYVLAPADDPWYLLRSTLGQFPQDFMEDREQPGWADTPDREAF